LLRSDPPRHARPSVLDLDVGIEDFAGPRIGTVWPDSEGAGFVTDDPSHRSMVRVGGAELGIVGLDLDANRILEPDFFEGLVPF